MCGVSDPRNDPRHGKHAATSTRATHPNLCSVRKMKFCPTALIAQKSPIFCVRSGLSLQKRGVAMDVAQRSLSATAGFQSCLHADRLTIIKTRPSVPSVISIPPCPCNVNTEVGSERSESKLARCCR